jgi:taurine dioxygenase
MVQLLPLDMTATTGISAIGKRPDSPPWPFHIRPLTPALGVEITDIDLSKQIDESLFAALFQAFLRYQVLLLGNQSLSPEHQVAFARHFGTPQVHVMDQYHADSHPELYRLSNVGEDGKPTGRHPDKGTLVWHTDGSWRPLTGQATIIYGEVVAEAGGETHFCDMYGAWERLSAQWKARVDGKRAVHNLDFSRNRRHGEEPMTRQQREATPPVDHPIVRTHPETGRKCLFLGDHAEYIVGLPYEQGRAWIETLNEMAVHEDLTYRHRWRAGDLLVWDNRCLMHRATPYDPATQCRIIRRCTVLDDRPPR